jgi:hypothetical protein
VLDEQPVELAGNPDARDRGISNQRQALAGAVIHDHKDAKPATVDELIGREVDRPALIRELRNGHWRTPCPARPQTILTVLRQGHLSVITA